MVKTAVTELEYAKARSVFEAAVREGVECFCAPEAEEALASAVSDGGAAHVVVGTARYAGPLYRAVPPGGVVARFGVGHDGIDKRLATAAGLLCTNTPGVLDDSVAEHTVALILAAVHHIPAVTDAMRRGAWSPMVGRELRGKNLAIIGCGPIGCRVARIAARGLQMRVIGCEIRPVDAGALLAEFGFQRITADFADAVRDADVVSLHIPAVAANRHFINAARLTHMRAGAWLINTARGVVVDESALYDALHGGSLAGAALDVFETEPYTPTDLSRDLRSLSNVIMTPHVGSSTQEACHRMAEGALRNILLAVRGDYEHMDLLNPEVVPRLAARASPPSERPLP